MKTPDLEKHSVLDASTIFQVGAVLLVSTGLTVFLSQFHFGAWNLLIALAVATFKASLVVSYFMGVRSEGPWNRAALGVSVGMLGIFLLLLTADIFQRREGTVVRKEAPPWAVQGGGAGGEAKFLKPWEETPELLAHGRTLFATQCVTCHGPDGKGDGPAAAALKPPPRNFHEASGWINGRKKTGVFKTLKEGIPGSSMASYANLSSDDLWGLVHWVLSFHANPDISTPDEFQKLGIDLTGSGSGGTPEQKPLPVDFILDRMIQEQSLKKRGS